VGSPNPQKIQSKLQWLKLKFTHIITLQEFRYPFSLQF